MSLLEAVRSSQTEKVRRLVNNGVPLNQQDEYGWTALHTASCYGHIKMVQLLVDKGAQLDLQTKYGMTALHWASRNNIAEVVHILIENGARVDLQNNDGDTALEIAQEFDCTEIVAILKQALVQQIATDLWPVLELCYSDQPGAAKYFVDLVGQFWGGVRALSKIIK